MMLLFFEVVSENDIKKIRRLVAPRADGSYIVPKQIADMWNDKQDGGREEVEKLWLQCGGDKDRCLCQTFQDRNESALHAPLPIDTYVFVPGPFSEMFCMCPQEAFVQKAKKRVESIHESDLWVDGKFMTEKSMVDDGFDGFFGYHWLNPLVQVHLPLLSQE